MASPGPIAAQGAPTRSELIWFIISLIGPVVLGLYGILLALTPDAAPPLASELQYISSADPTRTKSQLPPSLSPTSPNSPATIALSIVVPAYNESARLPAMLREVHTYLTDQARTRKEAYGNVRASLDGWEVIVVDDGSSDGTAEVALKVGREWQEMRWGKIGRGELRVVSFENNRGKGGAVKHGVLHSRGARVLFADADGASLFSSLQDLQRDLDKIEVDLPTGLSAEDEEAENVTDAMSTMKPSERLRQLRQRGGRDSPNGGERDTKSNKKKSSGASGSKPKLGVAIGSRAHLVSTPQVVKRSFLRNFLMRGFHLYVRTVGVRQIRDTQCGFKLFTRPAAALLFPPMHLERWSFDVELLLLAESCSTLTPTNVRAAHSIPISETPIEWTEVPGSKISLVADSLGMARDLLVLRICLGLGRWHAPFVRIADPALPDEEGADGEGEKKEKEGKEGEKQKKKKIKMTMD